VQATLTDLLKAYDTVLRRHGIPPAEDTHYYRLLLRLSVDPDPDWWAKLQRHMASAAWCVVSNLPMPHPFFSLLFFVFVAVT
jgi:protein SFI1